MSYTAPPPAYFATRLTPTRAHISSLPLHLLHRILSLTLDTKVIPSRYTSGIEEERVRRLWALFRSPRRVDRRFWLVATSILRATFLDAYYALVQPGFSSDPFPSSSVPSSDTTVSEPVFAARSRETAVFDRFIALKVGEDLRSMESELCEGSEGEKDIFSRLQPAARVEDLLLDLSPDLMSPAYSRSPPLQTMPLPHSHVVVGLTNIWAQVYLCNTHVGYDATGRGKSLVIEVRREKTLEGTVVRIKEALEQLRRGLVLWGARIQ
ncbi:hypothetical protein P7C73_g6394, partial [Tremellales sp. Uapishka_1]